MSEDQLVRFCAPTLAGIKTGSLFNVRIRRDKYFMKDIVFYNKTMVRKGIRIIPLKVSEEMALIYIYRPHMLEGDLKDPVAMSILRRLGYRVSDPDRCVADLARRLKTSSEFPHEIGLFLGYPPLDVEGFMRSPNEGFYEIGYWKVYSNVDGARRVFSRYRKCTEEYGRMLKEGSSLEQLVV